MQPQQQFAMHQPGPQIVSSPPKPKPIPTYRQTGSLVCGVMQICFATLLLGIGYMKLLLYFPSYGVQAGLGGIFSILAGGFGIHSSRRMTRCPTISALVFSILTVLLMTSAIISNSVLLVGEGYIVENLASMIAHDEIDPNNKHEVDLAILTIEHTMYEAAEGSMALMIVGGLANAVVSILQAVFTGLSVCTCCRQVPNVYNQWHNPMPEQRGPQPNPYNVDMTQMSAA